LSSPLSDGLEDIEEEEGWGRGTGDGRNGGCQGAVTDAEWDPASVGGIRASFKVFGWAGKAVCLGVEGGGLEWITRLPDATGQS
jgi:hypothetical protein